MKFPLSYKRIQINPGNNGPFVLGDISGAPALAVGSGSDGFTVNNNIVYFAISVVGSIVLEPGLVYTFDTPSIVTGAWFPESSVPWSFGGPMDGVGLSYPNYRLTTTTGDTQPAIANGPNGEFYVAFRTNGSMPNRYNMSTIPSFCPSTNLGTSDIVVVQAWIDLANMFRVPGTRANWWIQDASINSIHNESNPQLSCDRTNRFLYMVHQSDENILCFPTIGTGPNVVLSCITLTANPDNGALRGTGTVVWREAQTGINCAGATTNPAIATDQHGAVYVAVEINAPIQGGAYPEASQVIDVIKFLNNSITSYDAATTPPFGIPPGIFTSMDRSYVLSGIDPSIFPESGVCSKPTIACDPVGGLVVLAFTTTGTMPGQSQSTYLEAGGTDVVVISFLSDGTLLSVLQGDMWSPAFNPYTSARDVSLTSDSAGNIFISYIIKTAAGTESILAYQLYPSSLAQLWNYQEPGGIDYTAYAYAMTGAPNAIYNTAPLGSFTKTPPAILLNQLFIATSSTQTPIGGTAPTNHGLTINGFTNALYTFDNTVFNYMANTKSICACGSTNCGCS